MPAYSRWAPTREILAALRREMNKVEPRSVSWSPERVDSLITTFGLDDHTPAWAATMAPDDFLGVTSPNWRVADILNDEVRPLNLRELEDGSAKFYGISKSLDTPHLYLAEDFKNPGKLNVVGHEGRHRNAALGLAGAREVPIVLRPQYAAEGRHIGDLPLKIHPDQGVQASWPGVAYNAVKITPENRDKLLALGMQPRTRNHITYLLPLLGALATLMQRNQAEDADA